MEDDRTEMDLAGQLEELFRETGEAHHRAYIETDGADPEWPLRYADYLREKISNEQPLRAPGADWYTGLESVRTRAAARRGELCVITVRKENRREQ
jgi:hypothetical protein